MFTGLIQGLGSIRAMETDRFAISIVESSSVKIMYDLAIGDSVAVDGVCLTVEEILPDGFVATASPETLERTTLGQRQQAARYVNLETSMRVGSKLGGHFVTGHIDGIGCLVASVSAANSWEMSFCAPASLSEQWQNYIARYIVPKGSIAVNGISLTVAECDIENAWFKVAVIPHTHAETNLCHLKEGDWVNIESDILGKYVDKLLGNRLGIHQPEKDISPSFLMEHGYL